jgi:hypothetical protein
MSADQSPAQSSARLKIDLYGESPGEASYFGFHYNGTQHAAFCSSFAAMSWWEGLGRDREYFYATDAHGNRVEFGMNAHGHAYSILAKLDGGA